jgi:putative ABC transport system substrate-binding protein
MKLLTAAILVTGGLLSVAASAQAPGKHFRIGYIQTAAPEEMVPLSKAFEDGLRDLGYIEGRNVSIVRRYAMGRQERLPELAADLARLKVDVIVTGANPVIAAVKQATTAIPVVMTTSRDPVGSGFVASLARPGGNITGISSDPTPEVQAKRLELLKEVLPRKARVALLWNPAPPGAETYQRVLEEAAVSLSLATRAFGVRGRDEYEGAFARIAGERLDAVVVLPDPIFFTARKQVVALLTKHRLPAVFHAREFVEIGGFMSYGSSLAEQFRRCATFVHRILNGAKPAEMPVEQAARFELVINLKTAKALGLAIPPALRLRADEIIE